MHVYGFSTGALALGDFESGLDMLAGTSATAVELSALRDHELPGLVDRITNLELSGFEYVSIHAPSAFTQLSESACATLLSRCTDRGWPIVLHPDAIRNHRLWEPFGDLLCIENMDKRKPDGRTAEELSRWFDRFPDAGFCLDLGHARQVDPSLTVMRKLIRHFGDRLRQMHLSELDVRSQHRPLSMGTVLSIREVANSLDSVAVILESRVKPTEIESELRMARSALESESQTGVA